MPIYTYIYIYACAANILLTFHSYVIGDCIIRILIKIIKRIAVPFPLDL